MTLLATRVTLLATRGPCRTRGRCRTAIKMGGVAALRESEFTVLGGSRASAARPLHIVVFIVGGLPSLAWPLCLVSLLCLLCLVFRCVGDASRACVSCVVWRDTSAFTHHVWSLQRVVPLFGLPRVRASSKHLACVLRLCCVCAVCVQRVCIGER